MLLHYISINKRNFAQQPRNSKADSKNQHGIARHGNHGIIKQGCESPFFERDIHKIVKKVHSEAERRQLRNYFNLLFAPFYP